MAGVWLSLVLIAAGTTSSKENNSVEFISEFKKVIEAKEILNGKKDSVVKQLYCDGDSIFQDGKEVLSPEKIEKPKTPTIITKIEGKGEFGFTLHGDQLVRYSTKTGKLDQITLPEKMKAARLDVSAPELVVEPIREEASSESQNQNRVSLDELFRDVDRLAHQENQRSLPSSLAPAPVQHPASKQIELPDYRPVNLEEATKALNDLYFFNADTNKMMKFPLFKSEAMQSLAPPEDQLPKLPKIFVSADGDYVVTLAQNEAPRYWSGAEPLTDEELEIWDTDRDELFQLDSQPSSDSERRDEIGAEDGDEAQTFKLKRLTDSLVNSMANPSTNSSDSKTSSAPAISDSADGQFSSPEDSPQDENRKIQKSFQKMKKIPGSDSKLKMRNFNFESRKVSKHLQPQTEESRSMLADAVSVLSNFLGFSDSKSRTSEKSDFPSWLFWPPFLLPNSKRTRRN